MCRSERSKVLPGLLAVLLLVITAAWSPAALAVEGGTPVPATDCGAAAMSMPDEVLPDGVVRELLLTTNVDSTAFASEDILGMSAVASIVCIKANTEVMVGTDAGPPTTEIPQDYMVTLIVLEGDLELKLVKGCAGPSCTVTNGLAVFRTAPDTTSQVEIGTDWIPIPPGSIVALADVTISMRTGDDAVRLLSAGVAPDYPGGGACPSSCPNWRNP